MTVAKQWAVKKFTKFSVKKLYNLINVSVWLFRMRHTTIHTESLRLGRRIEHLLTVNGPTFTVLYLKEAHRLMSKTLGGESVRSSNEPRVASRRGLPLIIPGYLRLQIEAKEISVIRLVFTILTVYRVIPAYPKLKLGTITSPFSGLVKTLPELTQVLPFLEQYGFLTPRVRSKYFGKADGPFTVWRRMKLLTSAGPNSRNQLLGYAIDAFAWRNNPVLLETFRKFALLTNSKDVYEKLRDDIAYINDKSIQIDDLLKDEIIGKAWKSPDQLKLGKLSLKLEAAGKVRVFAIADAWTQTLLGNLHQGLFAVLSQIPQDGTFNQHKPVKALLDKGLKEFFSFDLSAATDRLPIDLQVDIISWLFNNQEVGPLWKELLVGREYILNSNNPDFKGSNGSYKYEVGQPMGCLSSWGMLALSHHMIVQVAARRAGFKGWFSLYAVLGDDIVIANRAVADCYLVLMRDLGLEINLSKSLISSSGSCEFAKKFYFQGVDASPIGPKSILELLKAPRSAKDIILNNNLVDVSDFAILREQLKSLFKKESPIRSKKWMERVKSTYWDIVSCFGLNLGQDLSPSLMASAINSLDPKQSAHLQSVVKQIVDGRLTRGWFQGLEETEKTYRKYRRYFSFCTIRDFPSTQHVLSSLSDLLHQSASKFDLDVQLDEPQAVKLAFSSMSKLQWALEDQTVKQSSRSKSLLLSKALIEELYMVSPVLAMSLYEHSQADSWFVNHEEVSPETCLFKDRA